MKKTKLYKKHLQKGMLAAGLFTMPLCFGQKTVYSCDFNDFRTGEYNKREIVQAIGDISFCNGADEGRVHITEVPGYGNVLDVKHPKGGVKTDGSGMHTKWYFNDDGDHEALYFSYDLFIPEDFEWATGGKLPGLACQTGSPDRFNMSLRLMWREEGRLEFYVHYNTKPTTSSIDCESDPDATHEASINWSLINPYECNDGPGEDQVKLKKGEWNHLKMYYKLNTPGEADGILRGWLNGKLAIDITDNRDMRVSGEENIRLNSMYFSSFFGTSVPSPVDTYMYFDNILVTTEDTSSENGDEEEENQAPTVSLNAPLNNTSYLVGDDIEIAASAADADGTIDRVEFYSNGDRIGTDDTAPYNYTIESAAEGSYAIKVKAFDNENQSATSSEITVVVNTDDNNGGEDPEEPTSCAFGTPASNALMQYKDVSFEEVHVLGAGGPAFDNFKKFRINWDTSTNRIKRFAINTNDGIPSYYVDLRSNMDENFGLVNPDVTLSGTGIEGLDGSYWVNNDEDNFVMVSKSGEYVIYFSNNDTAPSCESLKASIVKPNLSKHAVSMYPNPLRGNTLKIKGLNNIETTVSISELQGKPILKTILEKSTDKIDLSVLKSGVYLVKIKNENGCSTQKLIKF